MKRSVGQRGAACKVDAELHAYPRSSSRRSSRRISRIFSRSTICCIAFFLSCGGEPTTPRVSPPAQRDIPISGAAVPGMASYDLIMSARDISLRWSAPMSTRTWYRSRSSSPVLSSVLESRALLDRGTDVRHESTSAPSARLDRASRPPPSRRSSVLLTPGARNGIRSPDTLRERACKARMWASCSGPSIYSS